MEILTTRFGPIRVKPENRVEFPRGLVGVPHLRRFVLWDDPMVPTLQWLQSVRDPSWAFALIEPRSVVADYQVRTSPEHLAALQLADKRDIEVYVTLNRVAENALINLQAPILINRQSSLGLQLVLQDTQYCVRYSVNRPAELRKSA